VEVKNMDKWLNIKVSKGLLVISEQELMGLVQRDPELLIKALKRGKSHLRHKQRENRRRTDPGA